MDSTLSPFAAIKDTIFSSSSSTMLQIIAFWPNILGALGVILIGWGLSSLIHKFIIKSSDKLKLGYFSNKLGLDHFLKRANIKSSPAEIIAQLVYGYILTMFFVGAANIVKLHQIADFLNTIIAYIPRVVVAMIIVLFGTQISNTVGNIVKGALSFSHQNTANFVSLIAKYSLIFFSILAALIQLNVATTLVEVLFIGFVAMLSLGGGLALGLGGQNLVRELLKSIREEKNKTKKKINHK